MTMGVPRSDSRVRLFFVHRRADSSSAAAAVARPGAPVSRRAAARPAAASRRGTDGADRAPRNCAVVSSTQTGAAAAPGADLDLRHRRANPPDHPDRWRRTVRVRRAAGRPVFGKREQGGLRHAAVRTAPTLRAGNAGRRRRRTNGVVDRFLVAARRRHRRTRHRRIRRADRAGAGSGAAVSCTARRSEAADARCRRRPATIAGSSASTA